MATRGLTNWKELAYSIVHHKHPNTVCHICTSPIAEDESIVCARCLFVHHRDCGYPAGFRLNIQTPYDIRHEAVSICSECLAWPLRE